MILTPLEITVTRTALQEYLQDASLAGLDKEYPGAYETIQNALYKFLELDRGEQDVVIFEKQLIKAQVEKN